MADDTQRVKMEIDNNDAHKRDWKELEIENMYTLSPCDIRRLNASRARIQRYETIMNNHVQFDKGNFPGGRGQVGVTPPDGLLGDVLPKHLATIEQVWHCLVKNVDWHAERLVLFCIKKNRSKFLLKSLMKKANLKDKDKLQGYPLLRHFGRRFILTLALILANGRNDKALADCVTSTFKTFHQLGLDLAVVEELGAIVSQYLQQEFDTKWSMTTKDAWNHFIAEIISIGSSQLTSS